jgi:serine/threonine protein kinase/WD40 repeat protein
MADESQLLGQLAKEFRDQLRGVYPPDIEEYARRHPQLADRIRALFPTLAAVDSAEHGRSRLAGAATLGLPEEGIGLVAGQTFNHYRIERELGRGGMGVVYEAVHLALNKRVALKVLSAFAGQSPENLERFLREARTAAALHHTNIVPVFDIGQAHGLPYYAMQHIGGSGLDQIVQRLHANKPAPSQDGAATTLVSAGRTWTSQYFREVAGLGAQVAEALAYAHQRGVVHRDIKPSNLLLDEQGVLWITDFGLARRADDPALTHSGALLGTPRYMSPEQAEGGRQPVDHRTDIYSLGATLYEMVTGTAPYHGEHAVDILVKILEGDPRPPRRLNGAVPRDLETIILKAMARRPRDRYASGAAFADDLHRFLKREPIRARRIGPVGRAIRWCQRNPALAAVSAAAVAVILTLSGIYYAHLRDENAQTHAALEREQIESKQKQIALEHAQNESLEKQKALERARNESLEKQKALKLAELLRVQAETERDQAEDAREKARDHLVQSLYERVRGLNVSGAVSRRWQALAALKEAEQLRARPRKLPPDKPLPSRADLRSEAVMALLLRDARVNAEIVSNVPSLPWAFSPDGRLALSCWMDQDKMQAGMRLVDVTTGAELRRLEFNPKDPIQMVLGSAMALSPDGKVLASSGIVPPQQITLFDLSNLREIRKLPWPKGTGEPARDDLFVSDLFFSADGKYLAGHRSTVIAGQPAQESFVWDLAPGAPVPRLKQEPPGVQSFPAFNGRSTLLVYQEAQDRLVLWDLARARAEQTIKLPLIVCGTAAFSPDGKILAVPCQKPDGSEGAVFLWDLARNIELKKWDLGGGPNAGPALAAFSPDGKHVVLVFDSGQITLHHAWTGTRLLDLEKGVSVTTPQPRLFWQDGGRRLVTNRHGGPVKVWEFSEAGSLQEIEAGDHPHWPRAAALLAASPHLGTPAGMAWPALGVVGRQDWPEPVNNPIGFATSPDGRWLALAHPGLVRLVDRGTGHIVHTWPFPCFQLRFAPDSCRLAGFGLAGVCAWDVATGKELGALGSRVFDELTMLTALLARMPAEVRPVLKFSNEGLFPAVAFTADGRVLSLKLGTESAVWDVIAGKEVRRLPGSGGTAHLAPGGMLLMVTDKDKGSNPDTGKTLVPVTLSVAPAFSDGSVCTDAAGQLAVVFIHDQVGFGLPAFLNMQQGHRKPRLAVYRLPADARASAVEKLRELPVSSKPVAAALSPDRQLLALAFSDGQVQLFNVGTGEELLRWSPHTPPFLVAHLEFTADGTCLMGCDGQAPSLWQVHLPTLRRHLGELGLDW